MGQDVINLFQNEFGRLLTPIEKEIISDWKSQGYNDNQIREALKQSVFNGVINLRYISKILSSWKSAETTSGIMNNQEPDFSWLD